MEYCTSTVQLWKGFAYEGVYIMGVSASAYDTKFKGECLDGPSVPKACDMVGTLATKSMTR